MNEPLSPPPSPASRARRRRARRTLFPADAAERQTVLEALGRRAYPTVEFFLLSLVCGAVLGVGYLLDAPLILVFGTLSAPLLTPWLGMVLAGARGALGFWVQTATALLVSAFLTFGASLLSGLLLRALPPRTLTQAHILARLWPTDFVILAIGAIILVLSFVRSEEKPYLPSALLAYTFYLPLSAAAIGLGGGISGLWPHGVLVALAHLAWASLLGTLIFYALRFRPGSFGGVLFSGAVLLGWLLLLGWLSGSWPAPLTPAAVPTASPTAALTIPSPSPAVAQPVTRTPSPPPPTSPPPASTPSATPTVPFATLEVTPTLSPTVTPTLTVTLQPTPIYARVNSPSGGGAYLRKEPSFVSAVLIALNNGTMVQVFPGDAQFIGGNTWLRVVVIVNGRRYEGWMLSTVLQLPTPAPSWTGTVAP